MLNIIEIQRRQKRQKIAEIRFRKFRSCRFYGHNGYEEFTAMRVLTQKQLLIRIIKIVRVEKNDCY